MDGTGEHQVKQSSPGSKGQRAYTFPHMWKPDIKNKCIHKYMILYTHMYVERQSETDSDYHIGSVRGF
jgi:hypothetical protein